MVFVNTKAFVERVARAGPRRLPVGVLGGDVPQKKRESLLKKFQAGQLELLVATDVAARPAHRRREPRLQPRPAVRRRGLRASHRPHRAPRRGGRRDQLRLRALRDVAARHRGLHRAENPSEPVTQALLTALPRKPREGVAVAEDGESISEIFKGSARRAPPRTPSAAVGAAVAAAVAVANAAVRVPAQWRRRRRAPRARSAPAAQAPAGRRVRPAAARPGAARRRRWSIPRRPRGRRTPGAQTSSSSRRASGRSADAARQSATDTAKPAPSPSAAPAGAPSLLTRIGRGLKSLVTRAARPALSIARRRRRAGRHRRRAILPARPPHDPRDDGPAFRQRQQAISRRPRGPGRRELCGRGRRDAVRDRPFWRRQEHPAAPDPAGRASERGAVLFGERNLAQGVRGGGIARHRRNAGVVYQTTSC